MNPVFELEALLKLNAKDFYNGLDSAGSKGKSFASTIGGGLATAAKVGVKAMAAATAAVGAFGVASVKHGMEFDATMSEVGAIAGTVADEAMPAIEAAAKSMGISLTEGATNSEKAMELLRAKAIELGNSTKFTASEVGEGFKYMAMAGWDTTDMLQGIDGILSLAAASGSNLATTSDIVTDALTAMGYEAGEAGRLANVLAAASSNSNTNVELMGETFKYVAPLIGAMGYEMEDLAIAAGLMANGAIKGSMAGTGLRTVLTNLVDPSDEVAGYMNELGITLQDDEGKMYSLRDVMKQLRTGFGELALDTEKYGEEMQNLSDAFEAGEMSEKDYLEAMERIIERGGTAEGLLKAQAAAAMGGARGLSALLNIVNASDEEFDKLAAAIDNSQEAGVMYNGTLYDIEEAQKKFGDAIYDSAQGFKVLGSAEYMAQKMMNNLQGDITLLGSAFSALKIAVSDQLTPSLRKFVTFAREGLASITEAFNANGIDGAMDAFGKVLADGLSMILTAVPDFISAGGKLLGAVGKGIADNFPMITRAALDVVQMLVNGLAEGSYNLATGAMQLISQLATDIGYALPNLIPKAVEAVVTFTQGIIDGLPNVVTAAVEIIYGLVRGIEKAIPQFLEKAPQLITSFATNLSNGVGQILQAGVKLLVGLVQAIPQIIPQVVAALPSIISGIITFLNSSVGQITVAAVQLLMGIVRAIPETVVALVAAFPQIISAILEGLAQAAPEVLNTAKETLKGILKAGSEVVADIPGMMADFISGIVNGLTEGVSQVVEAGRNLAQNLLDSIQVFFGIKSPSTVMAEQGRYIDEGLGQGITEGQDSVMNPLMSLAEGMTTLLSDAWEGIKGAASTAWDGITGVLGGAWDAITGKTEAAASQTSQAASRATDGMSEATSAEINASEQGIVSGLNSIQSDVTNSWNQIKTLTSTSWNGIKQTITQAWNGIAQVIRQQTQQISQAVRTSWDQINTLTRSSWNSIRTTIQSAMSSIRSAVTTGMNEIKTTVSNAMNNIKTTVSNAWDQILSDTTSKWSQIAQQIVNQLNNVVQQIPSIVQSIRNAFLNENWESVGDAISQGIARGITNGSGTIIAAAKQAAKAAYDAAKAELDIQSPSKVMRDKVGKMISLGIAEGITDEIGAIEKAIDLATSYTGELNKGSVNIDPVRGGGYTQNVYITSPKELSPSEVARQTRNATRGMVYALAGMT